LQRQHTLLQVMAARLRETAEGLERASAIPPGRLRQALDAHRRFLVELHQANEEEITTRLRKTGRRAAQAAAALCEREHPAALNFQRSAAELAQNEVSPGSDRARALAKLFRSEAERIERHHISEEEPLYAHLREWLPRPVLTRLGSEVRRRDAERVSAESALISWSSNIHPASD
jgi:hemerythrin-like domain-containing protein